MDKTKEEFVIWLQAAINNRESGAARELYQFLVNCFVRADKECVGTVSTDRFDDLIEEAAALPRKYGFAPTSSQMFKTVQDRKAARERQFKEIDKDQNGTITLDEWVLYAENHVFSKASSLPKDYLSGSANDVSKDEFVTFIKKAVNKGTPEYKQLYFFLLQVFSIGDTDRDGRIEPSEFDRMVEAAAASPRRYGLAPRSEELFANGRVGMTLSISHLQTLQS